MRLICYGKKGLNECLYVNEQMTSTCNGIHRSRSSPMPLHHLVTSPSALADKGWILFTLDFPDVLSVPSFACTHLSLSVGGLEKVAVESQRLSQWLIKEDQERSEKGQVCLRCGQRVRDSQEDRMEHEDWHLALDLHQSQFSLGARSAPSSSSTSQKRSGAKEPKESKSKKPRKTTGTKDDKGNSRKIQDFFPRRM